MKRLILATSIAVLALPLCAQTAATDTAADSPLVAAARASKKANPKGIVITNDNLVKVGGHLSLANASPNATLPTLTQTCVSCPAKPDSAAKARAEADAKSKKDAAAKKEAITRGVAADIYGESIETRVDDPAMQEHLMNQLTSTQPQTTNSAQPQTVPTNPKPPEN